MFTIVILQSVIALALCFAKKIKSLISNMRDKIKEYEAVAKAAENFVRSVAEGDSKYA